MIPAIQGWTGGNGWGLDGEGRVGLVGPVGQVGERERQTGSTACTRRQP